MRFYRSCYKKRFNLQSVSGLTDFLANMDEAHSTAIALTIAPIERGALLPISLRLSQKPSCLDGRCYRLAAVAKAMYLMSFWLNQSVSLTSATPVVHIDFGVGRYQGWITLEIDRQLQEFIHLTYADDASVYVPGESATHQPLCGW